MTRRAGSSLGEGSVNALTPAHEDSAAAEPNAGADAGAGTGPDAPMRGSSGPRVLIVMGVSGSGKTTVGRMLAERVGWSFVDADDHHPHANVAKMARGEPLTDEDRVPWLQRLRSLIDAALVEDTPMVLACSALKQRYRDVLGVGDPRLVLVYLRGDEARIAERMRARTDHFFRPDLLHSQFEALEEPRDALVVDVESTPEVLTDHIVRTLALA